MRLNKDNKLDEKDPFQSELAKTNEDFMARETFFMEILLVQILNIAVNSILPYVLVNIGRVYIPFVMREKITNFFYAKLICSALVFLSWLVIIF